mgnify:CR=1 FL=1
MKIYIDAIWHPDLKGALGKGMEFEFYGATFSDLLTSIVDEYGDEVAKILLDQNGELKPGIQVFLNRKIILPRKELYKKRLHDQDEVQFMLLIGGG